MRFLSVLLATLLLLDQSQLLVSFNFVKAITNLRSTSLHLNRIFCDIDEVTEVQNSIESTESGSDIPQMVLHLDNDDYRCKHIRTILKLEAGDPLKGIKKELTEINKKHITELQYFTVNHSFLLSSIIYVPGFATVPTFACE